MFRKQSRHDVTKIKLLTRKYRNYATETTQIEQRETRDHVPTEYKTKSNFISRIPTDQCPTLRKTNAFKYGADSDRWQPEVTEKRHKICGDGSLDFRVRPSCHILLPDENVVPTFGRIWKGKQMTRKARWDKDLFDTSFRCKSHTYTHTFLYTIHSPKLENRSKSQSVMSKSKVKYQSQNTLSISWRRNADLSSNDTSCGQWDGW